MRPRPKSLQRDALSGIQLASLRGLHFAILLSIIGSSCLWRWQAGTPDVAIRSADVGTFISADSSQGSFFAPTLTNVHTTGASSTVRGTFSAAVGRKLSAEDLNKPGLRLCVVGARASCAPLAGAWKGAWWPLRALRRLSTSTGMV